MSDKGGQYARQAAEWTEHAYADVTEYLAHRAELISSLGPRLGAGDEVLDLACGDGGLGSALLARGLRYRGVDATAEMVAAARTRLGERAAVDQGDLNDYVPPAPVAATTVFRAIYYARDRRAFFAHAREYTTTKLVFDLNPRQYRLDDVLADLRSTGFASIALRPFFVPQT
ncbi:MAG: class I SAM-dependent methyltransferase, partial [Gaiellaceae bacterium]